MEALDDFVGTKIRLDYTLKEYLYEKIVNIRLLKSVGYGIYPIMIGNFKTTLLSYSVHYLPRIFRYSEWPN